MQKSFSSLNLSFKCILFSTKEIVIPFPFRILIYPLITEETYVKNNSHSFKHASLNSLPYPEFLSLNQGLCTHILSRELHLLFFSLLSKTFFLNVFWLQLLFNHTSFSQSCYHIVATYIRHDLSTQVILT